MSHSEEKEVNSEDQERDNGSPDEERESSVGGEVESEEQAVAKPAPAFDSGMANDPRFSRLMKMRSQYVTEEALRSTEEQSKPKPPEPADDEELYEDELYEDELLDEEEFDDFEDDDYEDPELARPAPEVQPPGEEAGPEPESEESDDTDHRVARLRKLRSTFVTEKDLEIKRAEEPEVYKETKVALVVCPNCQSEEPRGQKICGQCGAKLPNIVVEEEKYNPGTLNKAVLKYFDAVKKLKEETWSIDEFVDFMNERYDLSRNHIDGLLELIEECGSQEWLPEATKLIMESTLLLEDSIVAMIEKVEEVRAEHSESDLEEYAEEDEDGEHPQPPMGLEEKVLAIDFQPELNNIKHANGMMLNTLKLIDEFQKQAQADLEVSM